MTDAFPTATLAFLERPLLADFLATVLCNFTAEEAFLAGPETFAAFALLEGVPAFELVERRALGLPLLTALEPSGVDSAFEALRKERPIAAEATTLGAIAIDK